MVSRVTTRLRSRRNLVRLGVLMTSLCGLVSSAQETSLSQDAQRNWEVSRDQKETGHRRSDSKWGALVQSLGSDSFHTRDAAARQLIEQVDVSRPRAHDGAVVIAALKKGLSHKSLEVRMASMRTLRAIDQAIFDYQIDQLKNPHVDPQTIELIGWKPFSRLAGQDASARSLFARVAVRYTRALPSFAAQGADSDGTKERLPRLPGLDPHRLTRSNAEGWALLLSHAASESGRGDVNLSAAITLSLSNSALGPKVVQHSDTAVIQRLIDRWLQTRSAAINRETLLIAMRYQCHDQAVVLCDRVNDEAQAMPSCQAMALLCAAVLQRPYLESALVDRLQDKRTAHVWQLIASRRTRIRTQVRDVALALLLHHHQIDPREVGFDELQAHPWLVFREHSLGFSDDDARESAYQKAAELLDRKSVPHDLFRDGRGTIAID